MSEHVLLLLIGLGVAGVTNLAYWFWLRLRRWWETRRDRRNGYD